MRGWFARRRRPNDVLILAPAAGASTVAGAMVAYQPFLGAGLAVLILSFFSWGALTGFISLLAVINRPRPTIADVSIQLAHIALLPLAIRVFLLTRRSLRSPWRAVEVAAIVFILLQFGTSYLHSVNVRLSLQSAGLLALGVMAFLVVSTGICTRERLIFAVRALLLAGLFAALVGDLLAISHALFGTNVGISGDLEAVGGLAKEHDILGSTAASVAIVCLALSRERNPVFPRWFTVAGFWVSLGAVLGSLARGAWIGFAVAFVLLVLFRRTSHPDRHLMGRGFITVLALTIGGTAFVYASLFQEPAEDSHTLIVRASQIADFQTGTGQGRLYEWNVAVSDVQSSLLFGLGTNSYGQRHLALRADQPGYLGSLYVRTFYDSGIAGVLLLFIFVLGLLLPMVRLRWATSELAVVAIALGFGYGVLLIAYAATDASLQLWPWIFAGTLRAAGTLALLERRRLRDARRAEARPVQGPPRAPQAVFAS
jgi:hypothetical protein